MSNNGLGISASSAVAPPLATAATHRILAWPRYDRATDLEALCEGFGPALLEGGGGDVCLCLRHDRAQDIPLEDAARAVESAFTQAFGADAALDVLIVDDPLDQAGWAALGRAVTGVVCLPSSQEASRRAQLGALGHSLISSPDDLRRWLRGAGPRTATANDKAGQPLVSVIVPTFNRPELLQRALGSLTKQTFRDFEVVVANDGGAGIEELLQTFAPTLSIAYVRHRANRDRAAARNSALAVAQGRYIAYLNDDDCFRPDHLQTLVDALCKGTHQVAYSDATWVLEEKAGAGYRTVRPLRTRSRPFNREQLSAESYIPLPSVMHERACLDVAGAFHESPDAQKKEEWNFCVRLAATYDFLHVAKVTADISCRDDGEAAAKPAWLTASLAAVRVSGPSPSAPTGPASGDGAIDPADDQFLTQLVATYAHRSFDPAKDKYGEWAAQRAQAAQAAPDLRFENDRAVVLRHLLGTAASPTVALDAGNLASAVLQAVEILAAAPPAGGSSLDARVDDALARVGTPLLTVTSKRSFSAAVSSSERAALIEKILDQLIDVGRVPRFHEHDHLDDIVGIVRSRYAGPVEKHRARSEAFLRVLSVIAAGNPHLPLAVLPRAIGALLGPGHPYVPHRATAASQPTSDANPGSVSLLGGHEENHHMLLRALVDLRRGGRLSAQDEALVVGRHDPGDLAFFRKQLDLPKTIGHQADGGTTETPFADGRFALIYCAGTLGYSPNMRRTIADFARVLRRPGFMVLSDAGDRVNGVDSLRRSDSGGIEGLVGLFLVYPYRIIGQDPGRSPTPAIVGGWPCLAIELLPP
ncbi:MAG: hypothetical protein QOI66_2020 [Myxococcales bacterium]|nr:hypothetical protein [Myxococcales bacterium]